jgi:phosphate starvation-inducible PhoH-like protein
MKRAVDLLYDDSNKYEKIIIVRPAVEAEEKLGSLPGGLEEKSDPYIYPSYYLLNKIIGKEARETLKDVKLIMTEVGLGSYYQGQSLKPDIDAFLQSCGFKELTDCFERCFEYEGNAVYVKE